MGGPFSTQKRAPLKCPERTFTIYVVMSHRASIDRSAPDPALDEETDLRLATHLRALSRVALATGHDIRTPLHTMILYLQILRNAISEPPGPETRAKQERCAEVIGSEIKNLEIMLEQLINQTRVAEDRIERFDLVETLRDLHEFLEPHRRKTKIEFPWRAGGDAIRIEGNRGSIRHALVAILIAAIEATPQGGELTLGITAADGQARIEISGASAGLVPALGADRGLSVARRVVERHGGTIKVRSDASRVATLELQLPLAAAENG